MPIQYDIDRQRGIVRVVSVGRIDSSTVRDYLARLESDPLYEPGYDALIDVRAATSDMTPDDVRDIAELVRRRPATSESRRAVLVASDKHFGLMRMFEAYTSVGPTRYRVFRDPEEANAWLESEADAE